MKLNKLKIAAKMIAWSLALVMFFSVSGCVGENANDTDDTYPNINNLPFVTLDFFAMGKEKRDTKEVLDEIAQATDLNIKLNFTWYGLVNYFRNVKTAFASGQPPDAFICGMDETGTTDIFEMYRKGEIKDVAGLLLQYVPEIYMGLSEKGIDAIKVDGHIVFVPSLFASVHVTGIYVRSDITDRYGISSINTFDEYESILKKIKVNEDSVIPGYITGGQVYDIDFFANAYGYIVLDHNQRLVYEWDDPKMRLMPWERTPEFRNSVSYLDTWLEKGYIVTEETIQKTGHIELASLFCRTSGCDEGPAVIDLFNNGNKEIYMRFIPYKAEKIQRDSPLDIPMGNIAFSMESPNTERALLFLNWIQSSQENYDLFNYGIEGRHYVLQDERIGLPEGVSIDEHPYWPHKLDNELLNFAFMNPKYHRLSVYDTARDGYYERYDTFLDEYTSYAPHEGFFPDYSDVKSECENRMKIWQYFIDAFQMGWYDISETDNIIERLDNAGTDRIVGEIQTQLDKWHN